MSGQTHRGRFATALLVAGVYSVAPAAQDETAATLQRAAAYLAQYERDVAAVVAQEDYLQRVPGESRIRRLKSDLVIVTEATGGWVEFRDVFEVDGRAVRDRDQRIVRLFLKPNADALTQARQIVEESARFNLSPARATFRRTLNVPLPHSAFCGSRIRRDRRGRSTATTASTARTCPSSASQRSRGRA